MTAVPKPPSIGRTTLPPLQSGDRLTRDEFERRYHAMPSHIKAELIEGVVYMPAPVTDTHHANPHFNLIGWLAVYASTTSGVVGGDNGTLRLDLDNEPQPDAYLRILPECGGQALVDEDAYIRGAPELVAEVAGTSANYDLHAKLNAYRRNQVREYVVWRTRDEVLDWFILREGRYDRLQAAEDGIFRSEILPGLWLDPAALLCGDLLRVMDVVRLGVATSDHAKFIAKLASARQ